MLFQCWKLLVLFSSSVWKKDYFIHNFLNPSLCYYNQIKCKYFSFKSIFLWFTLCLLSNLKKAKTSVLLRWLLLSKVNLFMWCWGVAGTQKNKLWVRLCESQQGARRGELLVWRNCVIFTSMTHPYLPALLKPVCELSWVTKSKILKKFSHSHRLGPTLLCIRALTQISPQLLENGTLTNDIFMTVWLLWWLYHKITSDNWLWSGVFCLRQTCFLTSFGQWYNKTKRRKLVLKVPLLMSFSLIAKIASLRDVPSSKSAGKPAKGCLSRRAR